MNIKSIVKQIISLDKEKAVRFIILFGSTADKKNNHLSDIDLAVYYEGTKAERFNFRKTILGHFPNKVDLHIFQDLPLSVQKEVLKGNPLYYDNYEFMFDQCLTTIKDFNSFEKYYNQYLDVLRQGVEA
ncbi:nucleotidyltransferase domain-containing protein [Candidatus Woesearchaeota archaeon]|nr:nucleotidyltransferase domain-containing protein [Candidatus Woesearchaeota archaeon]